MGLLEEAGEVVGGTDEVSRRWILKALGAAGAAGVAGCSGDGNETEGPGEQGTVPDSPTDSPIASPSDTSSPIPSPTDSPTVSPTDTSSPTPSPTDSPTASTPIEWDYGSPEVLNKMIETTGINRNARFYGINTNAWDVFAPDEALDHQVENFNTWMIPDWSGLQGFGETPRGYLYVPENQDWDELRGTLDDLGFGLHEEYEGRDILNGGDIHPGIDYTHDVNYVLLDEANNYFVAADNKFGGSDKIPEGMKRFVDVADDRAPSYDEEGQPFHALSESSDDYVLNSERSIGFMMMPEQFMPEFAVGGTSLNMNGNNYPVTMQVREDGQGVVMRQLVVSDDSVETYDDEEHVYDDFSPMSNTVDRNTYPGMTVWKD